MTMRFTSPEIELRQTYAAMLDDMWKLNAKAEKAYNNYCAAYNRRHSKSPDRAYNKWTAALAALTEKYNEIAQWAKANGLGETLKPPALLGR